MKNGSSVGQHEWKVEFERKAAVVLSGFSECTQYLNDSMMQGLAITPHAKFWCISISPYSYAGVFSYTAERQEKWHIVRRTNTAEPGSGQTFRRTDFDSICRARMHYLLGRQRSQRLKLGMIGSKLMRIYRGSNIAHCGLTAVLGST